MLHLGIVKTFDSENHKAGVQLVGSLTTYLDDISVSVSIASSAMVVGNYVLVAIPGGNPRDACVVASWPAGSSGITDHGELDGLADDDHSQYLNVARHDLVARHPLGTVVPHESALNNIGNVNAPSPTDDQALAWDAATSKWIAQTLGGGGGGSKIQDADGDTWIDVEKNADEDHVRMGVAGVEAFDLDSNGIRNLPQQSAASGYRSGNVAIPTGVVTKIMLNRESYDVQNEFDTTNGKYVASTAGRYLVVAKIRYVTNLVDGKRYMNYIFKNGVQLATTGLICPGGDAIYIQNVAIISLAANDYLELWTYQLSGGAANIRGLEGHTEMSVYKLG